MTNDLNTLANDYLHGVKVAMQQEGRSVDIVPEVGEGSPHVDSLIREAFIAGWHQARGRY